MARRWMPASNQARFGAGIIALAWAFVVERATRIELALSAWEAERLRLVTGLTW